MVNDIFKLEIDEETGVFNETTYYLKYLPLSEFYATCIASTEPIKMLNIEKMLCK